MTLGIDVVSIIELILELGILVFGALLVIVVIAEVGQWLQDRKERRRW